MTSIHLSRQNAAEKHAIYLHTIEDSDLPYPYPLEFFNLLDTTLPPAWKVAVKLTADETQTVLIGFSDWAEDIRFYEKLVAGDERAVVSYKLHRRA